MERKLGFTLAEVLITLGIIGVVAAMTIPTLMNATGEAQYKAGLKKVVATLSQAVSMTSAVDDYDFSTMPSSCASNTCLQSLLQQRASVVEAGTGSTVAPTMGTYFNSANTVIFFSDGTAISYASGNTDCKSTAPCTMAIDVNGRKGPNRLSTAINTTTRSQIADQFSVRYFDQQVVPFNKAATYAMYDKNNT